MSDPEREFVDELDRIVTPVLATLTPEERATRLKNLEEYLDSLENENK